MQMTKSFWTLKKKLLAAFFGLGLLPLLIAGAIVTKVADDALINAAFKQLESAREMKRSEIEGYFRTIESQVLTLSESTMTVEAVRAFRRTFHDRSVLADLSVSEFDRMRDALRAYYKDDFGTTYLDANKTRPDIGAIFPDDRLELYRQYRYIAGNEHPLGSKDSLDHAPLGTDDYDQVHKTYHGNFRNFLNKFGYYDIFLLDPDTGHIVYSVFKELDYATSLSTGPYKNTNFARAFQRAKTLGKGDAIVLEDFEPYTPSYEAAASFIASPIYSGNTLEGVLIFQMPVGRINEVMGNNAGLGETGQTYLVGADGKMRSQDRHIDADTVGKHTLNSDPVKRALAGKIANLTFQGPEGGELLASYAPLKALNLDWAIVAEIQSSEALMAVEALHYVLGTVAVVVAIIVLVVTLLVVRGVWRQLGGDPQEIQGIAESIAANNLTMELESPELSTGVYAAMSKMRDNLRDSIERDHRIAAENARIKQALDCVDTNVMVTDEHNNVIYMNDALRRLFSETSSDIRKDIPGFNPDSLVGDDVAAAGAHRWNLAPTRDPKR